MRSLRSSRGIIGGLALAAGLLPFAPSRALADDISVPGREPVDRIVVEKAKRTMTLFRDQHEVGKYRVAIGQDPVGPKTKRGDMRTPEGIYFVDYKVRHSRFYKALHLTYPNRDDRTRADSLGVPPGRDIMIHGMSERQLWMGDVQYLFDWTYGCIALTNSEIDQIWELVTPWTLVEIKP